MKSQHSESIFRFIVKPFAVILGISSLGYLGFAAYDSHRINQDMNNVLDRYNVTFESSLCQMNQPVNSSDGTCQFSATSEQVKMLVNRVGLERIETTKDPLDFVLLDPEARKKPQIQKEMRQSMRLSFIKKGNCWAKLSSQGTSKLDVYDIYSEVAYKTPFDYIKIIYSESTRKGCIQVGYPTGYG
jgi:hypothetical protein